MIVITDGESHDSPDLEKVIEDSEKDNVTRYAVAVSAGGGHPNRIHPYSPPSAPIAGCQAQRFGVLWGSFVHRVETPDTFLSQPQVLGYYNRRGINPEAFLNEIKFIASDPDDKHFFNVTDEAALKDIVDALGERIFSLEGERGSSPALPGDTLLSTVHPSQICCAGSFWEWFVLGGQEYGASS